MIVDSALGHAVDFVLGKPSRHRVLPLPGPPANVRGLDPAGTKARQAVPCGRSAPERLRALATCRGGDST
jgi:hypothetical protein